MIGTSKRLITKIYVAFFLIFLIPFSLFSNPDKIELRETDIYMKFTHSGKIIKKYRKEFIESTGVNGNIKTWDALKNSLGSSQQKSTLGEVAARLFFEDIGYQILEKHYQLHLGLLYTKSDEDERPDIFKYETCTTKKGPDNGIDGLFILQNESLGKHSHFVINESKFRDKDSLSVGDFGFVKWSEGGIQQSHSKWNSDRFSWPTCLPGGDYDSENILRTATLLDKDGTLKLYEIRDKDARGTIKGEFASEAPQNWNIRYFYDKAIKSKVQ